jgi:hypothetical protein
MRSDGLLPPPLSRNDLPRRAVALLTVVAVGGGGLIAGCDPGPVEPEVEIASAPATAFTGQAGPGGGDPVFLPGSFVRIQATPTPDVNEILSGISAAASAWNEGILEEWEDLPTLATSIATSDVLTPRIAITYEIDGSEGWCGEWAPPLEKWTEDATGRMTITKKDLDGDCEGRIVQDVQGVVMHEMANVLGMIDVNSEETRFCILNVPDTAAMNKHPCTYEEQILLQMYGIRDGTLIPSNVYIAKTVQLSPGPGSVVVGDTLSLSVTAIAGPEPSDDDQTTHVVSGLSYSWSVSDPTVLQLEASSSRFAQVIGLRMGTAYVKVQASPAGNVAYPWPRDSVLVTVERATDLDPCFDEEGTSTYLRVDQFLEAEAVCGSPGPGYEYRWRFEETGAWTAYASDPVYEFPGHTTPGEKVVTLEVRETATGDTAQVAKLFTVAASAVEVSGPTYVTDKGLKTYVATQTGDWHERLDPATYREWGSPTLTNASTYNRIWPAGYYDVALRNTKTVSGEIRRRRVDVEVCWQCGPEPELAGPGQATLADGWGLFGAGPWIVGGEAERPELAGFYDLTGLHEEGTPFAAVSWLEGEGGTVEDAGGRWTLEWRRLPTDDPDVLGFAFTVVPRIGGSYEFGLAVDPDLGSPVDDEAGYDGSRGMAYAFDGARAVGFLLRDADGDALASVREFGARRFAPRGDEEAWSATRETGVDLLGGPDDVQFVLSAAAGTGPGSWRFWIVRGADPRELAARADALLERER